MDGVKQTGWSTAAQQVVNRVFVYGTLREGHAAHSMIADHVTSTEPATTTGRIVAFTDGYPGLLEDDSSAVVGELVTLRTGELAPAFSLMDAYEGDDFIRALKKVKTDDGRELWAWCYVLANPAIAAGTIPIPHGDWLRYSRDA